MNLHEIQANIRLRNPWEAVDLGFSMVQAWWKSIYLPLSILTMTIALLLYLSVPKGEAWIAGMIFWWLKPLYDRLVLHIISHKLFNEELSSWQALQALPSLIWNTGFFQSLTFRRFSLSRGFNLPIWQLEQLRGQPRIDRQNVLHIAAASQANWLTIGLWCLEGILGLSLFVLVFMFLPEQIQRSFFDDFFNKIKNYGDWLDLLNYFFYIFVLTFVHPFYIAGNFALYINRRTQLEAWDIELDFRKLSGRLKQAAKGAIPLVLVSCVSISLLLSPINSIAADVKVEETVKSKNNQETEFLNSSRLEADKSKSIIKEVMLTEFLDNKIITHRWVKIDKEEKKDKVIGVTFWDKLKDTLEPVAKFIAFLLEFGLWLIVAFGIILLIYFRERWLHLFQGKRKKKEEYESPDIMFGMDVRPESLPQNIAEEARSLWQSGQHRESLSLLYRGALVRLINRDKVKLQNSHTEGDVLLHSALKLNETKQGYLKLLTTQWQLIAYAHRSPAELDMQTLFDHWESDFAIDIETDQSNNGEDDE